MMDVTQLANDAVAMLAPLLPAAAQVAGKLADHVTEGFLNEPGAKLFDWIAEQFKGKPAAASLERAIAEPQDKDWLESLRIEIRGMAKKDELFRQRLEELVTAATKERITANQNASPIGDGNKIGQAAGKDISIQVS